jgi:hypothetical protein
MPFEAIQVANDARGQLLLDSDEMANDVGKEKVNISIYEYVRVEKVEWRRN